MIICADDFGMSEAVSRGIIELIDDERVTATSCMVTGSAGLQQQMNAVAERQTLIDIGLHLTLTDVRPLSPLEPSHGLVAPNGQLLSYGRLLSNCYRGRVDQPALQGEISAQLTRFEELTGFLPAYIDGHQHAHQLPIVREALLQTCADSMPNRYYIRCGTFPGRLLMNSSIPPRLKLSSTLIGLPAFGLRRVLKRSGIPHNTGLLGHYNLPEKMSFEQIFRCYLQSGADTNEVYHAHPGYVDSELESKDPMTRQRSFELEFLRSSQFSEALDELNISLNRFQYS